MKIFNKFLSICLILVAPCTHADTYVIGKVQWVRVHDNNWPGWAPPLFWFTLSGVNIPGCQLQNGSPLLVSNNQQAFSLILAAQLAEKQVSVYVDQTKLTNGFCNAQFITIGNPPPASL